MRAERIQNDANMTDVFCLYSDKASEIVSKDYSQGFSMATLENFYKDVRAMEHKAVHMFLLSAHSDYLP